MHATDQRKEARRDTPARGDRSPDARHSAGGTRTAPGTNRSVDSPESSSPIPGPGASNTGHSAYDGGSAAAGLDRSRTGQDVRPEDSDIMDSAISGEDDRASPPDIPESQRQGRMHGDINDPEPDRPDPEGIPRASKSDRTDTD